MNRFFIDRTLTYFTGDLTPRAPPRRAFDGEGDLAPALDFVSSASSSDATAGFPRRRVGLGASSAAVADARGIGPDADATRAPCASGCARAKTRAPLGARDAEIDVFRDVL
jgi:hypothetical protein|eukprot:29565-Pelagococcus_subviridis.AAC.13